MIALNSNVIITPIESRSDVHKLIGYDAPVTTESRKGVVVALPEIVPQGISIVKVGSVVRYKAFNTVEIDGAIIVPASNLLAMED